MSTTPGSSEATAPADKPKQRPGLAFLAAWLGWAFDGLDGFLYTLVALPFVAQLMGLQPTDPQVSQKAAIIQAVFLVGWAFGGAFFGRIGDKLGRTKTLNLTILTYAIFTGLSALAGQWWHLLILRFLAALGIGGEWAAGSALVSETLPPKYRHWASAILQSGYMTGMLLAAQTVNLFRGMDPRWVFVVGVVPALLTLWIRKAVPEPEEWANEASKRELPKISALFGPEVRKTTWQVLGLSSICLCGAWTILYFAAQLVRKHPDAATMNPSNLTAMVSGMVTVYTLWNIVGNFAAAGLTKWIGYRKGFVVMLAAALVVFLYGFSVPRSIPESQIWINAAAFFGLGVFASFPLYFPPLFPTLLRTTGAGFCYNAGRLVAAGGTLVAGTIDPGKAFYFVGFLYIPAILIAMTMPELPTKEEEMPAENPHFSTAT